MKFLLLLLLTGGVLAAPVSVGGVTFQLPPGFKKVSERPDGAGRHGLTMYASGPRNITFAWSTLSWRRELHQPVVLEPQRQALESTHLTLPVQIPLATEGFKAISNKKDGGESFIVVNTQGYYYKWTFAFHSAAEAAAAEKDLESVLTSIRPNP